MKRIAHLAALGLLSATAWAQGVTPPYVNNFDSATWQGPEWTLSTTVAAGRVALSTTAPTSPQGGTYLNFDVTTANTVCTTNLSLAVQGAAVTPGTLLKYWAKESGDEADAGIDGCFISNGVVESRIVDHTTLTATWQEFSVDLWAAATAANIPLNSSFRVIFRWRDNTPSPQDGLQIDAVRINAAPPPDSGQANSAAARLTMGVAANINNIPYFDGVNGPFFASKANGSTLTFTVQGPANSPYVLLAGPLNRNNLVIPGIGSLDIGSSIALSDVIIVIDGTIPGFFNGLAVLPPSGTSTLSFPLPTLPAGVWTTFQVAVVTPTTVTLSAATQITVS